MNKLQSCVVYIVNDVFLCPIAKADFIPTQRKLKDADKSDVIIEELFPNVGLT